MNNNKKLLALALSTVTAFSLAVASPISTLAQTNSKSQNIQSTNEVNNQDSNQKFGKNKKNITQVDPNTVSTKISLEDAKKIAQKQSPNSTVESAKLIKIGDKLEFIVKLKTGENTTLYKVDSETGEVSQRKNKAKFKHQEIDPTTVSTKITMQQAKNIALQKSPNATVEKSMLVKIDDKLAFIVIVKTDDDKSTMYKIDADNGSILETKTRNKGDKPSKTPSSTNKSTVSQNTANNF